MVEKKVAVAKDMVAAAKDTSSTPLDHFPPLITYACLGDASPVLALAAHAGLVSRDVWLASEALTMPRKGAGPRLVTVLSPTARTMYSALVGRLAAALPEESRATGAWDVHRAFGRKGDHSHVVELDYASCYETIEHARLRHELVLRSMDPDLVGSLMWFLGVIEGDRGLPQMLNASDRLADAYLSVVDRRLEREDYRLHRYADDTRVLASSWEQANTILEAAAEFAREAGLILAGSKTGVRRTSKVDQAEQASEDFQTRHLEATHVDLTELVEVPSMYGSDFELIEPEEAEKIAAAGISILTEWAAHIASQRDEPPVGELDAGTAPRDALPTGMVASIGKAIQWAAQSPDPLDAKVLEDLVFHYPLRLEDVCRYLIHRATIGDDERKRSWDNLTLLARMGRQSPWAKLWLLHAAGEVRPDAPPDGDEFARWVQSQLTDDHEVVRAEAAWTAATWGVLDTTDVSRLYRECTSVTQPAVTAVATRQPGVSGDVLNAMRTDSPLNEQAHKWAS